ncbi:MAG: type II toxin-antitoxin system VapB family antitoxin [Spirochaetia bacterium]|nr:type II toxin-antitoxin system VapB family antitoxin [Spirochaetia bacterium]
MRTTLDIPENLFNEAKALMRFKSKTDVMIHALTEYIRRKKLDELTEIKEPIELDIDVAKQRRRSSQKA